MSRIRMGERTQYRPGFIAFPSGFASLSTEAVQPSDSLNPTQTIPLGTHEPIPDQTEEEPNDFRRERQRKIQEEGLKAELEYIRLGGRIPKNDAEAELRQNFDVEAKLTEEERLLLRSWEEYDKAWDRLLLSVRPVKKFIFRKTCFTFDEIPWPVLKQFGLATPFSSSTNESRQTNNGTTALLSLHDFTIDTITPFLLHPLRDPTKSRKEKLRNAILHYHPDKFSRFLHRVDESDRALVLQGIDVVIRVLNQIMDSEVP